MSPPSSTTMLSVNLNKIALLRNSRGGNSPDLIQFADIARLHGAGGITVHPRPDQRHIRNDDVAVLAEFCQQQHMEFNIEGNPFSEAQGSYTGYMALAQQHRPSQCTLVPDAPQQLTSDHGFKRDSFESAQLTAIIKQLQLWDCRVSIFVEPQPAAIEFAIELGVDRIELFTGAYAHNYKTDPATAIQAYKECAAIAHNNNLGINAGHDLNLDNLAYFIQNIPTTQEVSIGHALIDDALQLGMAQAVQAYIQCLHQV